MFQPILTTPPGEAIVSLDEAKAHCRVDDADNDGYLDALILAATSYVDGYSGVLGRALVTQSWRQDFCGFTPRLALPLAPVVSVTSVKYFDANNVQQTLSTSIYSFLVDHRGPYVGRLHNQNWPSVYDREDPVQVNFVAGYGSAADVPPGIKQAMLLLIGHWYDNRAPVVLDLRVTSVPLSVDTLLFPFRRIGI